MTRIRVFCLLMAILSIPQPVDALVRSEQWHLFNLYRGANLINVPIYKTSTGTKFKASELASIFIANMIGRLDASGRAIGYIPGSLTPDFDIDPRESYIVMMGWARSFGLFGYGHLSANTTGEEPPAYKRPVFNSWGFPEGVPHMMTYEDLRAWPGKFSSLKLPGFVLLTTERNGVSDQAKFVIYHPMLAQNKLIEVGQGFHVWLWGAQVVGAKLPSEGSTGFAHVVTTVGRSSTAPGKPAQNLTLAKETPMSSPEGVKALSTSDPELVAYCDTGNHQVRRTKRDGLSVKAALLAGNGFAGLDDRQDGTNAQGASLNSPRDLEYVPSGDTYFIADTGNWRIRKVQAGLIFLMAGKGFNNSAQTGDGGNPREARLVYPSGLVSYDHEIYIVDRGSPGAVDGRVRKFPMAGGGTIQTFAGGGNPQQTEEEFSRTAASFKDPMRLAMSWDGKLYVTDPGRSNVRRVAEGTVTTFVGSINQTNPTSDVTTVGQRRQNVAMRAPWSVTLDGTGLVFVSDVGQRKLYRVGYVEERVSWVAGDGFANAATLEPLNGSKLATTATVTSRGLHSAGDRVVHFSETLFNRIRRLAMRP